MTIEGLACAPIGCVEPHQDEVSRIQQNRQAFPHSRIPMSRAKNLACECQRKIQAWLEGADLDLLHNRCGSL